MEAIVSEGNIPENWHSLFRVAEDKTELLVFLSEIGTLLHSFTNTENLWLVVTYGDMVRKKPGVPIRQGYQLVPCSLEKAHSQIFLRVAHAADHGHSNFMIRTVTHTLLFWPFPWYRIFQQMYSCGQSLEQARIQGISL